MWKNIFKKFKVSKEAGIKETKKATKSNKILYPTEILDFTALEKKCNNIQTEKIIEK